MAINREAFSHFLHERRLVLGKAWKQILSDAYLSRATLHRIRHGDPHHPIAEADSLRALAHALHFDSWNELARAFDARNIKAGLTVDRVNGSSHVRAEDGPREDALLSLPPGLHILEMRQAKMVPHFTSGIAASHRVEKLEDEDFESRQPANIEDFRVFTIPVDGDCQHPVWKDGEIVLFSFDAYDREGILPGKSYYLAFTDGSTTFKRVFVDAEDPETYVLRCWNTARYPQARRVHFSEVVRIARAISKQVMPED